MYIQRTHDHEKVEHVVLHHVPPGSAVQYITMQYNAIQTTNTASLFRESLWA